MLISASIRKKYCANSMMENIRKNPKVKTVVRKKNADICFFEVKLYFFKKQISAGYFKKQKKIA